MEERKFCGAHTKRGNICQNRAGFGTNHVGRGPCKLHGGCSLFPEGPANPNFRHGRYSKYRSPERVAEFEQWRQTSGTHLDKLSSEVEWGLFCLEDMLSNHAENLDPDELAKTLNEIADLRLKAQRLRGGQAPDEVNVNLNARDELLSRITGLAARRRAGSGPGEPDGG